MAGYNQLFNSLTQIRMQASSLTKLFCLKVYSVLQACLKRPKIAESLGIAYPANSSSNIFWIKSFCGTAFKREHLYLHLTISPFPFIMWSAFRDTFIYNVVNVFGVDYEALQPVLILHGSGLSFRLV
jgi:hypothetical protein